MSRTSIAIACLLASSAMPTSAVNTQLVEEFKAWKESKYGQLAIDQGFYTPAVSLQSEDEVSPDDLARFASAKTQVEKLNAENKDAVFSVDTKFAMMTDVDFVNYVKLSNVEALKSKVLPAAVGAFSTSRVLREESEQQTSKSVDWTTSKCIGPVKNQGRCGSCWAFSTVAMAEYANCFRTKNLDLFSEQQLTSCYSEDGCKGDSPFSALSHISRNGICLQSDYPYTSGETKVSGDCINTCTRKRVNIGSPQYISGGDRNLVSSLQVRPTMVLMYAGNPSWKLYKSGIIESCPEGDTDHALLAVGYGEDNEKPFFKIRNSWGENWGEAGYLRVKRYTDNSNAAYTGTCYISSSPMFTMPR